METCNICGQEIAEPIVRRVPRRTGWPNAVSGLAAAYLRSGSVICRACATPKNWIEDWIGRDTSDPLGDHEMAVDLDKALLKAGLSYIASITAVGVMPHNREIAVFGDYLRRKYGVVLTILFAFHAGGEGADAVGISVYGKEERVEEIVSDLRRFVERRGALTLNGPEVKDIVLGQSGSVGFATSLTNRGREWIEDNLAFEEWQSTAALEGTCIRTVYIDPRALVDIHFAASEAGLNVGADWQ